MFFFYNCCNLDIALFPRVASSALAATKSITKAIDRSLFVAIARYTLFKCVPAGKVKPAFATFAALAFPISCAFYTGSTAFFVVVNALVAEPRTVTLRTSTFGYGVEKSFTKLTLRAKSAAGTSAAPSIFQTAFAREAVTVATGKSSYTPERVKGVIDSRVVVFEKSVENQTQLFSIDELGELLGVDKTELAGPP